VRLKDVTDLLATSGLAERTYTIIGQGLVDQALSLRAEERRALFEEAAGINHYKSRRAETLRRLQETQRNLQRVHDILAEIRPRLASSSGRPRAPKITSKFRSICKICCASGMATAGKWPKKRFDGRGKRPLPPKNRGKPAAKKCASSKKTATICAAAFTACSSR
jgi:hypothetical protein